MDEKHLRYVAELLFHNLSLRLLLVAPLLPVQELRTCGTCYASAGALSFAATECIQGAFVFFPPQRMVFNI